MGDQIISKQTPEELFLEKDFPVEVDSIVDLEKLAYDNLKSRKDILIT